jgi:hypothetical protein
MDGQGIFVPPHVFFLDNHPPPPPPSATERYVLALGAATHSVQCSEACSERPAAPANTRYSVCVGGGGGGGGDEDEFAARGYDAFGLIGTIFRELGLKTLIFFERAVPISPNAW